MFEWACHMHSVPVVEQKDGKEWLVKKIWSKWDKAKHLTQCNAWARSSSDTVGTFFPH